MNEKTICINSPQRLDIKRQTEDSADQAYYYLLVIITIKQFLSHSNDCSVFFHNFSPPVLPYISMYVTKYKHVRTYAHVREFLCDNVTFDS